MAMSALRAWLQPGQRGRVCSRSSVRRWSCMSVASTFAFFGHSMGLSCSRMEDAAAVSLIGLEMTSCSSLFAGLCLCWALPYGLSCGRSSTSERQSLHARSAVGVFLRILLLLRLLL